MQNKLKIATLIAGILLVSTPPVQAEENFLGWLVNIMRTKEVRPVSNHEYQEECKDCHYAYQPGLLPAKSWDKLLNAQALQDHFGDNAEIDKDTLKIIHDYAVEYAADKSYYKRSRKITATTPISDVPLRITELRYIKRKHEDIPDKMIKGNKDVKSLSFCDKCHTQAEQGVYDNDTVSIPNYPDWED